MHVMDRVPFISNHLPLWLHTESVLWAPVTVR